MDRERLAGNVTQVERVGSVVFRTLRPWSPTVHRVLRHLETMKFEGAPRFIRIDGAHEVLTFIPGTVPTYSEKGGVSLAALTSVGALLRSLDSALDTIAPPRGNTQMRWRHGYVSIENCVFRGDTAIAFIDFDYVRPLPPWWDLHRCAWQSVPLADPASCRAMGVAPAGVLPRLIAFVRGYDVRQQELDGFMARAAECAQELIDNWQGSDDVPRIVERQVEWINNNASRFDDGLAHAVATD